MTISSIGGSQAAIFPTASFAPAGNTTAALASVLSSDGGLIANVGLASSSVSAALENLTSALGSILDTTA